MLSSAPLYRKKIPPDRRKHYRFGFPRVQSAHSQTHTNTHEGKYYFSVIKANHGSFGGGKR